MPTRDSTDANALVPGGGCWHGQPARTRGTKITRPSGTEGAGEHTRAGAMGQAHQVMFDWLDITLTR